MSVLPLSFSGLKAMAVDLILPCFFALARDVTQLPCRGPILVIAPHPDDEVLSCGAAITLARSCGHPVMVLFVTDGSASSTSAVIGPGVLAERRRAEALAALHLLGCTPDTAVFLSYRDGTAAQSIESIAADIRIYLANWRPALVFSPYGCDPHPDHRAVAAALDLLVREHAVHCPVLEYPRFQPYTALTHLLDPRKWRRFRCISTSTLLDTKRLLLAEHRSQCENLTGEPGWQQLSPHWLRMFFQPYELFLEKPLNAQ